MKKSECKKLDYFDHLDIILHVEKLNIENLYAKICNYKAVKLRHRKWKNEYVIIHKSTKNEKWQMSYFDELEAVGDCERTRLEELVEKIVYSYNIIEKYVN